MSLLCVQKDHVLLSAEEKACLFRLGSTEVCNVILPKPNPTERKQHNVIRKSRNECKSDEEITCSKDSVCCLALSTCCTWLAVCSVNKQLSLWDSKECKLISERSMRRAASSITFTPDSKNVVVVDKSGDAYLFSVEEPQSPGQLILGHLSMLLDVLVTPDGKHIITCDRDEKIRVSQFPNSYNIASFCLGHEEFVSSIALLPHDTSVIISSSGDGTLRLWNYVQGSLLTTYICLPDSEKIFVEKGINKREHEQKIIAVSKVCCGRINADSSAACAIIHGGHGCLLYRIAGQGNVKFLQVIPLEGEPLDACFSDSGDLWLYTSCKTDPVQVFIFDSEVGLFSLQKSNQNVTAVLENIKKVSKSIVGPISTNSVSQLFKQKFDNVTDYLERKRARIGES